MTRKCVMGFKMGTSVREYFGVTFAEEGMTFDYFGVKLIIVQVIRNSAL